MPRLTPLVTNIEHDFEHYGYPGDERSTGASDPGPGRGRPIFLQTQRYMHRSPAATEDAIRLLDGRHAAVDSAENSGGIVDTREATGASRWEGRA